MMTYDWCPLPAFIKTGKARVQNACDKCSICLSKTAEADGRDTIKNIFEDGTYTFATSKCLSKRSCQACEVKSVTYRTGPTGNSSSLWRILENVSFPPQSYLLNIDFNLVSGICRDIEQQTWHEG